MLLLWHAGRRPRLRLRVGSAHASSIGIQVGEEILLLAAIQTFDIAGVGFLLGVGLLFPDKTVTSPCSSKNPMVYNTTYYVHAFENSTR